MKDLLKQLEKVSDRIGVLMSGYGNGLYQFKSNKKVLFADAANSDLRNATAIILLLDALEAKGYQVLIANMKEYYVCEAQTFSGKPVTVVDDEHNPEWFFMPDHKACATGSTRLEALIKVCLAVCTEVANG